MTRPAPLCLALALGLAAPLAAAQSPPRRVVGFGSSLGVFTERNSFGTARTGPLLPTISVHASITPRVELELWVPLVNTLVAPVPTWVWMDLTARWYPLRDAGGLFVQGGLGFMYVELANEAPFGVLRVPARVGWEFTTARVRLPDRGAPLARRGDPGQRPRGGHARGRDLRGRLQLAHAAERRVRRGRAEVSARAARPWARAGGCGASGC